MAHETLRVSRPCDGVAHVVLARGHKRNAMNGAFFAELGAVFDALAVDGSVRAIVLSADGPAFSAGLDLAGLESHDAAARDGEAPPDSARVGLRLRTRVLRMQQAFSALERCPQPVVALIHGACIGGGVDLVCCADVRWCAADASFCVKEVELGLAADLGTLQRLPGLVGSRSLACELAFSARDMRAAEAAGCGLVSRVLPTRAELVEAGVALAARIAAMPPVAVAGTKAALLFSRDHAAVADGLEHVATWNSAALQTRDIAEALAAKREKRPALYSRL
jgi:delta(3,5)-delta(2,4)-dienoyl-CoA isomerase